MGAMNAWGHLIAVSAGESTDELWDFCEELCVRRAAVNGNVSVVHDGPGVHGFPPESDQPRYCFHPDGKPGVEFRSDDLRVALTKGAAWLARQLPDDDLWRRDG